MKSKTSALIERLRPQSTRQLDGNEFFIDLCDEAADEIERLQREVANAERIVAMLAPLYVEYTESEPPPTVREMIARHMSRNAEKVGV